MNVIQLLLTEAADLSSGEKIENAIRKGMVPGVKAKLFFPADMKNQKAIQTILGEVQRGISSRISPNNYNAAVFLLLKKARTMKTLVARMHAFDTMTEWVDILSAYFNNKNKQEVKTDPETKKRFEAFANSSLNYATDHDFEQWANKKFEKKATIKDKGKEIQIVYPKDSKGWEVAIPKTYAAAKKLACMADRKAHWCTSADLRMFKEYSKDNNPLYIIRNDKKNIMFQMDWGYRAGYTSYPNFKDEGDLSVKIDEFYKHNPPDALTKAIKNKEGKSVFSFLEKARLKLKDKNVITKEKVGKWEETTSKSEKYKTYTRNAIAFLKVKSEWRYQYNRDDDNTTIEQIISNSEMDSRNQASNPYEDYTILKNEDEDHFYVVFKGKMSSKTHGVLLNPIVKFTEYGRPSERVSKAKLEKDIGSIPPKTAAMISGSENIKEAPTVKPFLERGNRKLYKINDIEELKQFVKDSQEEELIKKAEALGSKKLYLLKLGITKIVLSKDGKALKITSNKILNTTFTKQILLISRDPEIFKAVTKLLDDPSKEMRERPYLKRLGGKWERGIKYYYKNVLNKNSKEELRKILEGLKSQGYKFYDRGKKTDPKNFINMFTEHGFMVDTPTIRSSRMIKSVKRAFNSAFPEGMRREIELLDSIKDVKK